MLRERKVRKGFLEPYHFAAPGHTCRRRFSQFSDSPTSPPAGSRQRSCRSSGGTSSRTWRTVRLEPGTTKNREGRTFPYPAVLQTLLVAQEAERDALAKTGRIVP